MSLVKMRSPQIREGPKSNDWYLDKKGRRQRQAHGKRGRDWNAVATNHRTPRIVGRRRQGRILCWSPEREHGPVNTLILYFWPLELGREYGCVVLSPQFAVLRTTATGDGSDAMQFGHLTTRGHCLPASPAFAYTRAQDNPRSLPNAMQCLDNVNT